MIRSLLCLLLLAVPALSQAQTQAAGLAWTSDYEQALEQALLTRRPLLVTFTTSWCGWCRKLEGNTFQSKVFTSAASGMIPVRVDGDKERGLVSLFGVSGYPTTVMLDRTGREIGRVVGYQGPEPFAQALQAALSRRESLAAVASQAERLPEDPEAAYDFGDVLLALHQFEPAREQFRRVIALDPSNRSALADDASLDIGVSYVLAREFGPAVTGLETYLKAYPQSERREEGLFFLGLALIAQGRTEEGVSRMKEASRTTRLDYIKAEDRRVTEAASG